MEAPITLPVIDLPTEDGEPLESDWHRAEIGLLIESLRYYWRDRTDFYTGGNMFVYYSFEQVRNRDYKGPDFFVTLDVDGSYLRKSWIVWEEGGRYPDVIVELLSPTTAETDLTAKKALYETVFHSTGYFCYDPDTQRLQGWGFNGRQKYADLIQNDRGWLWCETLGLWLGLWEGKYLEAQAVWLRFFDADGNLVLTKGEAEAQRAEAEARRADTESQRANQAEAELVRLRERLRALGMDAEA